MEDALFDHIDARRDELVELTRTLVRIPTVNPPGDAYQECAEAVGEWLRCRGFDVTYVRAEGTPGDSAKHPRMNVVARRGGRGPGPCIHFNGHIDVVRAGSGWSVEPFAAEVRDGRIYGRGTCDMKGGLAAAMIAADALWQTDPDLPGAIEVSGTADEESGGYGGVAYLARQGRFSPPAVDHVIIPEPLNVDRVCLGHRGVWWAEIQTLGHIAHGSMPFLGDCAVRHMTAFLTRLESELYPALARKRTTMPVVPEGARQSTLNINSIHGGLGEDFEGLPSPMVPDSCRLVIDRRFLIEEQLDEVKGEVVAILEALSRERQGFRYQIRDVMEVLPSMTDEAAAVVRAVDGGIARVLGRSASHVVSPGTYDQKHIDRIGHLRDCIAYGPGILDLAHQPDEYVEIDHLVQSAKVMAVAARDLVTGRVR